MNGRTISPFELTPRDLDRELIARGVLTHPGVEVPGLNPALSFFTTREIRQKYRKMIERKRKRKRGIWGSDQRRECCEIPDKMVGWNARSVTAVCLKSDVLDTGDGYRELKVKNYGETYDLCSCERFFHQPVSAGLMCTGVLVAADVVATAAHFARETRVRNLCFLFGYMMDELGVPVTRFLSEKVYHGVEVLHRKYDVDGPNATMSDWTLVRLDRKVEGQAIAALSKKPVFTGQSLYVLGHPCGLPLKHVGGGMVKQIEKACFVTEMDLYSSNSGSPVFCTATHELVGIVSLSDPRDFDRVDDCYVSVVYPHKKINSHGDLCIKVSEFNEYINEYNKQAGAR